MGYIKSAFYILRTFIHKRHADIYRNHNQCFTHSSMSYLHQIRRLSKMESIHFIIARRGSGRKNDSCINWWHEFQAKSAHIQTWERTYMERPITYVWTIWSSTPLSANWQCIWNNHFYSQRRVKRIAGAFLKKETQNWYNRRIPSNEFRLKDFMWK